MSTEILTSLAMLKVNIDQDQDHFDYLRPFIIQVLIDERLESIQEGVVNQHVRARFGLQIPAKTVQLVLKRLANDGFLKKEKGNYQIVRDFPDTGLADRRHDTETHINAVVTGLMRFADELGHPFSKEGVAITAICAFLSEFNIQCLRAYKGKTIIPSLTGEHAANIVLVSKYITHIQTNDADQFTSFIRMVEGHMCANALLCPDLKKTHNTYEGVTFYFDTPLLIPLTGANGSAPQIAVKELLILLHKLGGETAMFSHSRREVENVLFATANNLRHGYGQMVIEAHRQGMSKSDLLDIAAQSDEIFDSEGVKLIPTPPCEAKFQISEPILGQLLDQEVQNYKKRAQEYDIDSVRSIYVLRKGSHPTEIEEAQAIFVTSNQAFARAAWKYGYEHERRSEIATVITDFSLANIAWLKAPMAVPDLPEAEILALCYAALQPKEDFIDEFLEKVDKLEEKGAITDQRLQALRSVSIYGPLMALTLGSKEALTDNNLQKAVDNYEQEIVLGERSKHESEKQELRDRANVVHKQLGQAREFSRLQCAKRASVYTWSITAVLCAFLLAVIALPLLFSLDFLPPSYSWELSAVLLSIVAGVVTFVGWCFGTTVRGLYRNLNNWLYKHLLRRRSRAMGLDLEEHSSG